MDQLIRKDIAELESICPGGIKQNVDLSAISQWRIGGNADLIVCPSSTEQLVKIMRWFSGRGVKPVVMGLTSNLLFADEGVRVPILQIGTRMAEIKFDGTKVHAQAGVWVPSLARRLMIQRLTGAEHICGIPGTLGGLLCMNGGTHRKGIGSSVVSVTAVNQDGRLLSFNSEKCGFDYRRSVFQSNNTVVAKAILRFDSVPDRGDIRRKMLSILRDRSRKFPRKQPSCGSVFKSNPDMYDEIGPPGAAIDRLGLKGYRIGDAQISPHHANFFVNLGSARASDMLALIAKVIDAVHASTGYWMEPEVRFVTPAGEVVCADGVDGGVK